MHLRELLLGALASRALAHPQGSLFGHEKTQVEDFVEGHIPKLPWGSHSAPYSHSTSGVQTSSESPKPAESHLQVAPENSYLAGACESAGYQQIPGSEHTSHLAPHSAVSCTKTPPVTAGSSASYPEVTTPLPAGQVPPEHPELEGARLAINSELANLRTRTDLPCPFSLLESAGSQYLQTRSADSPLPTTSILSLLESVIKYDPILSHAAATVTAHASSITPGIIPVKDVSSQPALSSLGPGYGPISLPFSALSETTSTSALPTYAVSDPELSQLSHLLERLYPTGNSAVSSFLNELGSHAAKPTNVVSTIAVSKLSSAGSSALQYTSTALPADESKFSSALSALNSKYNEPSASISGKHSLPSSIETAILGRISGAPVPATDVSDGTSIETPPTGPVPSNATKLSIPSTIPAGTHANSSNISRVSGVLSGEASQLSAATSAAVSVASDITEVSKTISALSSAEISLASEIKSELLSQGPTVSAGAIHLTLASGHSGIPTAAPSLNFGAPKGPVEQSSFLSEARHAQPSISGVIANLESQASSASSRLSSALASGTQLPDSSANIIISSLQSEASSASSKLSSILASQTPHADISATTIASGPAYEESSVLSRFDSNVTSQTQKNDRSAAVIASSLASEESSVLSRFNSMVAAQTQDVDLSAAVIASSLQAKESSVLSTLNPDSASQTRNAISFSASITSSFGSQASSVLSQVNTTLTSPSQLAPTAYVNGTVVSAASELRNPTTALSIGHASKITSARSHRHTKKPHHRSKPSKSKSRSSSHTSHSPKATVSVFPSGIPSKPLPPTISMATPPGGVSVNVTLPMGNYPIPTPTGIPSGNSVQPTIPAQSNNLTAPSHTFANSSIISAPTLAPSLSSANLDSTRTSMQPTILASFANHSTSITFHTITNSSIIPVPTQISSNDITASGAVDITSVLSTVTDSVHSSNLSTAVASKTGVSTPYPVSKNGSSITLNPIVLSSGNLSVPSATQSVVNGSSVTAPVPQLPTSFVPYPISKNGSSITLNPTAYPSGNLSVSSVTQSAFNDSSITASVFPLPTAPYPTFKNGTSTILDPTGVSSSNFANASPPTQVGNGTASMAPHAAFNTSVPVPHRPTVSVPYPVSENGSFAGFNPTALSTGGILRPTLPAQSGNVTVPIVSQSAINGSVTSMLAPHKSTAAAPYPVSQNVTSSILSGSVISSALSLKPTASAPYAVSENSTSTNLQGSIISSALSLKPTVSAPFSVSDNSTSTNLPGSFISSAQSLKPTASISVSYPVASNSTSTLFLGSAISSALPLEPTASAPYFVSTNVTSIVLAGSATGSIEVSSHEPTASAPYHFLTNATAPELPGSSIGSISLGSLTHSTSAPSIFATSVSSHTLATSIVISSPTLAPVGSTPNSGMHGNGTHRQGGHRGGENCENCKPSHPATSLTSPVTFHDGTVYDPNSVTSASERALERAINAVIPFEIQELLNDGAITRYNPSSGPYYYVKSCQEEEEEEEEELNCSIVQVSRADNSFTANGRINHVEPSSETFSPSQWDADAILPAALSTRVRSGETLQQVADFYGIPIDDLKKANSAIKNPNAVRPSLVVNIPAQAYTVKSGDSLEAIAAARNISTTALHALNSHLEDPDFLVPGEKLKVAATDVDKMFVYTVEPRDTLWAIANKFDISLAELEKANAQIADFNQIVPGQMINVPVYLPSQGTGEVKIKCTACDEEKAVKAAKAAKPTGAKFGRGN